MKTNYPIRNNEQQQQFEVEIDGHLAVLEYRLRDNLLFLMHTEVPDALGGKGIGSELAHHALEWARTQQLKVKVYCAFVKKYLQRHKEYEDLLA
jgi:predicted GNAT family acetyltransferase